MSASNQTVIAQQSEIISVICRNAVSEAGILANLQGNFPSTGWTASLLSTRLSQGRSQGLYKGINSSGDPSGQVDGWQVNSRALYLNNPINKVYDGLCSNFLPRDPGCACINPQSVNH